jgi:predicted RND superfamily exporter protein
MEVNNLIKFGKFIVKFRIPILIIAVLLLIPSFIGISKTRINYDMLNYLPDNIDTVKGQNILKDDFGKGAFSLVVVEGMTDKEVADLKAKFEQVDHVDTVVWYNSIADLSIPAEVLPDKIYNAFNKDDCTMLAVFFDTSTSSDETMQAITSLRNIAGTNCFISGMSAAVTDLKNLCEQEEPIYVMIAVICACAAMVIFMDSWLIPIIFLLSIGVAIVLNLGTNMFLGDISYITKALSAVLQLAVTMDYSIFLWHSYEEQIERYEGDKKRAMAHAISHTLTSVIGSSLTTIAGFAALCFMTFTLGLDLGIVMSKGVLLGVIGSVTTLPALILLFDKPIEATRHKALLPNMDKISSFITGHSWIWLVAFVIILVPALYGYMNTDVYYDMSESLPSDMQFVIANTKLKDEFDMSSTHMILCKADLSDKDATDMLNEVENVEGVKNAIGINSIIGSTIPEEIVPDKLLKVLKTDKYQLILVSSEYKVATDEVNNQIDEINRVIKKYDSDAMLIGEAPLTKDMITITDHDFQVVDTISIVAIFLIIAIVLQSFSLPFILVMVIEFAIFINLGLPFYQGVSLPFIAPICISTIQLGATVDYAILMTNTYKTLRYKGTDKKTSITKALSFSIPSIIVSAIGLFAATFGVALYSNIDIIKSMCMLLARGALISMASVIFVLPSLFMVLDKIICKTGKGFICKTGSSTDNASEGKELGNYENAK